MINDFLYILLIGHFLGDFYLQSDKLAREKEKSLKAFFVHSLIYSLTIIVLVTLVFGPKYLKFALLVSLIHFFVDLIKRYITSNTKLIKNKEVMWYFIDQFIHIITIVIISILANNLISPTIYNTFIESTISKYSINLSDILKWSLALIVVMVPASVTIRNILYRFEPRVIKEQEQGHPGAGSLVGVLERIIILLMLSLNQYAVIGFVLTAKSIARYNKIVENPKFSEYYLLGTLASMLFVIAVFMVIF